MSSLAATQADGYYVPPEYFESGQYKHKSRNQFAGSKGHNQYLQKGIVRFELPYKSVCGNCHESIARGTRFNAHKTKTEESYFTTPIWEFQLSCRKCQHPWRIRTDPKERGFDYVEGVTIQAGQEDVELQAAVPSTSMVDMTSSGGTIFKTHLDRLESIAGGQRKSKTEIERLQGIQELNSKTTLEDADLNAVIRKGFRGDRKLNRLKQLQVAKAGWREGMQWLNSSVDDQVAAKSAVYGRAHDTEQRHFGKVRKSSIFEAAQRKRKRRTEPAASPETVKSAPFTSGVADPGKTLGGEENRSELLGTKTKQKILVSVGAGGISSTLQQGSFCRKESSLQQRHAPTFSLHEMLTGYGSSDSDN